ncbi:MAG TPA: hypothetical protein VM073_01330 [Usitatibacter sp.]|nr:hypothetical protein [Usitatibacter sp.]
MAIRPITNIELVDRICNEAPFLREARRRHLADYQVLMPHVFMADILAFVGSLFRAGAPLPDAATLQDVRAVLACLEEGMRSGDRETRNVIALSFVSDAEIEAFFVHLRPMLGARLQAEAHGR